MPFFFVSFNTSGPPHNRVEGRSLPDPDFIGASFVEAANLKAARDRLHEMGVSPKNAAYQFIEMSEADARRLVTALDAYMNDVGSLFELRTALTKTVAHRRSLGDYDANAAAIRVALESNLALVQHIMAKIGG